MSAEAARASVAPFYKALNAEFAKESPDLVRQATALEWVSCRGNDLCNSRDEVIAGIAARLSPFPTSNGRSRTCWFRAIRSPSGAKRREHRRANSWARRTAENLSS
jgi:hypothetical protein